MLHEHDGPTQGIRFVGNDFEGLSIAIHPVITPDEGERAIPRESDAVAKERTADFGDPADIGLQIITIFVIPQDIVHTHRRMERAERSHHARIISVDGAVIDEVPTAEDEVRLLILDELHRTSDIVGRHCFADMQVGEEDQTHTLLGLCSFGYQTLEGVLLIHDARVAHIAVADDHRREEDRKGSDEGDDLHSLLYRRASRSVELERARIDIA